ncbi:kinase-like protein [Rhizophagus irregularis]|uniref:Kinase-like protein n=1 Tax=Rhizophagus irregularis TaxID=588596 RepID=A0A2I1HQI9_9GLOM|nr:kinase-like protein [Rhizophagus irregularis]
MYDNGIRHYNSHNFSLTKITSGGFSSVYAANWNNTTKFAIKHFNETSKEDDIINEIKIIKLASHPSIIQFYGVTKLKDEKCSLVLEYADGGTLEKHLRVNAATLIKLEIQLRFAKEIAWAILWLHDNDIIHGDLHPKNVLIHQNTIKLADFGCSRLHGTEYFTKPRGIISYMDPIILKDESRELTKKSDIYSLGVVFWELTSCKSPFGFESKNNDPFEIIKIKSIILNGIREEPISGTIIEFVTLYRRCWRHEPQKRPDINEIMSELKNIDHIDSKNSNESKSSCPYESKPTTDSENEHFGDDYDKYSDDESNSLSPEHFDFSFDEFDIDKYQLPKFIKTT